LATNANAGKAACCDSQLIPLILCAGSEICSDCGDGLFSVPGSGFCETENSKFLVNVTFALSTSFTQELQYAFRSSLSQVATVLIRKVIIVRITQARRLIAFRFLLGSVLVVEAEITAVGSILAKSLNAIGNKTVLDDIFVQSGLPASTELKVHLLCNTGQYLALAAASACTECSAGTYSSLAGLVTSCRSCAAGEFSTSSGSTKCSSVIKLSGSPSVDFTQI
jgi:hypothetical protein